MRDINKRRRNVIHHDDLKTKYYFIIENMTYRLISCTSNIGYLKWI